MNRAKAIGFVAVIATLLVAIPVVAVRSARPASKSVNVTVQGFTDAKVWRFSPSVIRATYGDTVHVHFEAVGAGHGFRIQGKPVDLTAYPGLPQEAVFVADWVGGKEFYCTFDCGMGHGQMSGMIVVTR
jgi:heme/copper-type cytochrome/quinol oxidase subunit 2